MEWSVVNTYATGHPVPLTGCLVTMVYRMPLSRVVMQCVASRQILLESTSSNNFCQGETNPKAYVSTLSTVDVVDACAAFAL